MLLSIIVPIFNSANTLEVCLRSLLAQELSDYEIICVDDGSTDNTSEILMNLSKVNPKIKVVRKTNGGLSSARNAGIEVSAGEFIGFVDADDFVERTMFPKMIEAINNEKACLCGVGTNIIYQKMSPFFDKDKDLFKIKLGKSEVVSEGLLKRMDTHVWNKLFRRKLIDKYQIRFPEGLWYEDLPFLFNYLCVSRKVTFVDEKLYNYIRSEGTIMSMTFQGRNLKILDHVKVVHVMHDFMQKNQIKTLEKDFLDIAIDSFLTSNSYLVPSKKIYLAFPVCDLISSFGFYMNLKLLKRFFERLFHKCFLKFN